MSCSLFIWGADVVFLRFLGSDVVLPVFSVKMLCCSILLDQMLCCLILFGQMLCYLNFRVRFCVTRIFREMLIFLCLILCCYDLSAQMFRSIFFCIRSCVPFFIFVTLYRPILWSIVASKNIFKMCAMNFLRFQKLWKSQILMPKTNMTL